MPSAAGALARQLVGMAPRNPEVRVTMARALECVGDHDGAQAHRLLADELLRGSGNLERLAENAFQVADSAARNRSEPEALRWMRQALEVRPALRDEVLQVAALVSVLAILESNGVVADVPWWQQP